MVRGFKRVNIHRGWWAMGMMIALGAGCCSSLSSAGRIAGGVGKAGWSTAKVVGGVMKTTGQVVWSTGKTAHKGARAVVYMAKGRQIVSLERRGNSLYAKVRLNRKVDARFLVDTGASSMQVSRAMARRLGINLTKAEPIRVGLAGGFATEAYRVNLNEVAIGGVRVRHVEAVVLAEDHMDVTDGLIGMSFLNHFDFQINPQVPELILRQKAI